MSQKQLAKQFRVLTVFCRHLSHIELTMSELSPYWSKNLSSNIKFLRSLSNIFPKQRRGILKPLREDCPVILDYLFPGPAIQKEVSAAIRLQQECRKKTPLKFKTENQPYSLGTVSRVYELGTVTCKSWTTSLTALKWLKRCSAEFGFLTGRTGVLYGDLPGLVSPDFRSFSRIG